MTQGGIAGEPLGQHSFEMGDAYEGKFTSRFILGGKLYYNKYASPDPIREYVCVDLHTGEELWSKVLLNNLTISYGQLMYWDTYDYHGIYDYLWASGNAETRGILGLASNAGNPLCAFDPVTGDFVYALYGLPSGTRVMGPKGEILYYNVNLRSGTMMLWNSTNVPALYANENQGSMGWGQWRAMNKVVNATGDTAVRDVTPLGIQGYQWNVTIPDNLPGSVTQIWEGDEVVGGSISNTEVQLWALNLNTSKGALGQLLFSKTWTAPAYWATGNLTVSGFAAGWACWSQEDQVGVMWIRESREHYAFSTATGDFLWGPTEPQYYLDSIEDSPGDVRNIAYGKLYTASVSGIVYCYDVKTGERLWTHEATDQYSEILWANTWWMKQVVITDGKLYVGHAEHSPIDPRPRGAPFICLNATTGEVIWQVNGLFRQTRWGGRGIMGDSILATQDTYDQRIYAIGKGPSAIKVQAPLSSVVLGSSVVITGTVTDVSPGTENYALRARFPNGVPAVSDASMSEWMLYVYKQYELPMSITGVPVSLSVIDANGNYREIGTTTADADGFFSFNWTPDIEGKYTVYASFTGSEAYYPSHAVAAFAVDPAAPTPAPTQPPAESAADMYFIPAVAGIIAAIAIVGVVVVLVLRKRP
jgi:outer membrane protein assembly factor BamB